MFIWLKLPTWIFGPLLGIRKCYLLGLQEAFDVYYAVFLWGQPLQERKLFSESRSWTAGYPYISLLGREHFIISRCTPRIIRRQRSLGVPNISDDSQAGWYRRWHLDLTLPWLRNKPSNLKNYARDYVQVTFEPLVRNLGFIGFFERSYVIPGLKVAL